VVDLDGLLANAGLQLVQTNHEKLAAAQAQAALIVPTQHVPRERQLAPQAPTDPLVQVETRRL
jgi:hypothetical protein